MIYFTVLCFNWASWWRYILKEERYMGKSISRLTLILTLVIFFIVLIATVALCVELLLYYRINAASLAQSHLEPQVDAAFLQIVISIILTLVISKITPLRNAKLWYIIPIVLVVFSVLYLSTITPCPICAYIW